MPPRRKTVTTQTMIGEQGIALITSRCLQMGYLFHPRRVDHGIDGHIDLVDLRNRAVLNQTLLVQSKAQARDFPRENEYEFYYTCDERDLQFWLSGNAPVVLIFSRPDRDEAWWVHVQAAFPDAATRAKKSLRVDKTTQKFDKAAAAHLLRLAIPKSVGLYLSPPPKDESLTSNLMPIIEMPPTIHTAPALVTDYRSAGERLRRNGERASGWILRDGLVISFEALSEGPLHLLCDGNGDTLSTEEWAMSGDIDLKHMFAELLSKTTHDAYPELRWHKDRRHLHFRASSNLKPFKAGSGKGTSGRTVFGPYFSKKNSGEVAFYRHAALKTRFRRLASSWYCEIEHDYCFTSDGFRESPMADKLLAGIKRIDRSQAVSQWTRMWARHLTAESDLYAAPRRVILGDLVNVELDRGIDENWWGAAPGASESGRGSEPTAENFDAMDSAMEDLMSMIDPDV